MAQQEEIIIPTRLGKRVIDPSKIIHFPRGLAGFEGLHQFILLQIRPDAPMLILQSMDNEHIGLLVADPFSFLKDYEIKLNDGEQGILQITSTEQVAVLVTASIPKNTPEEIVLNLTGPILINHAAHIGLQVPQSEIDGSVRIPLRDTATSSSTKNVE